MRRKRKSSPLLRTAVLMAALAVLAAAAALGLYMYYFHIPEPEGLSLASWPETFTENFSHWLTEDADSRAAVTDSGIQKLDEYGLWIQVIDENGYEVFAHSKPADYPVHYTASELIAVRTSSFKNGYTVFTGSFESSGVTWNYIIGFPYAIGKYLLYYNGRVLGRLRPLLHMAVCFFACAAVLFFTAYTVWLTKQLSKITGGIETISARSYTPLKEKGVFAGIYAALNRLDTEIRQSDKIQADTDKARNDWIANITHDLKTPLSPVKGYAELLADHPDTEIRHVQEYGAVILKNISYAENLINDLKLSYQLDSCELPYHPQDVRFQRYIKELVIDMINDPAFAGRDIRFECEMPEFYAAIDPGLLWRAVQNLIINALIHNPPDTEVTVSITQKSGHCVCVSIRDNGTGIREAEQSELFSRYYRGTGTREKPEGSGLGLAIAKQIVQLHGGDITVKSKPGTGTEFEILLPL